MFHQESAYTTGRQQQQQRGERRDLFDLVVVDEAGQGVGPEVLLPLSLARSKVCMVCAAVHDMRHLELIWFLSCLLDHWL